jgi:hypothetical protein
MEFCHEGADLRSPVQLGSERTTVPLLPFSSSKLRLLLAQPLHFLILE